MRYNQGLNPGLDIEKDQVFVAGKQPYRVCARSVLAYWAIRDLGLTATEQEFPLA